MSPVGFPRPFLRVAASHTVANGMLAALGMMVISIAVQAVLGPFAAAAANVGVVVAIPSDQPAPIRGKFWQLLPAAVIGLPLFWGVQRLHAAPLALGLLLIPATFLAFLAGAWGKRGLPITMSVMFSMIFSLAVPETADAQTNSLYFALGAGLYVVYGTLANALFNGRYRALIVADTLWSLGRLMRVQAVQLTPDPTTGPQPLLGRLLSLQATLADQLQATRDLVLESPHTPVRRRFAGMLLQILELRDHLVACVLDLDALTRRPDHAAPLAVLRSELEDAASQIEGIADALLLFRKPPPPSARPNRLEDLHWPEQEPASLALAHGLAIRIGRIRQETDRLAAMARGDDAPDLTLVRSAWQMFVSPTAWSWRPFATLLRRDTPTLRHAVRAALAIGVAYPLTLALPWGTHEYWVLLTIVVVLRGSFAQTIERRNNRALGTLAGCLIAQALLSVDPPHLVLLLTLTLAQAFAHGFAARRYLVTAVAATILGLVQAHLLSAGTSPILDAVERLLDTGLGVTLAWGFSYILPSWERSLIPSLVTRVLKAQARHAEIALAIGQLQAVDNEPELEWRLARREAYDSLSALVRATQQSLAEPRAVRPPLALLERLLAHSYQLLAQLQAVKTMLLLRRGRLDPGDIRPPLLESANAIMAILAGGQASTLQGEALPMSLPPTLPDPFEKDLAPWVLRRLSLAQALTLRLRQDADRVCSELGQSSA